MSDTTNVLPLAATHRLVIRNSESGIDIILERVGRKRQRTLLVFSILETGSIMFSTGGSMELPWAVTELGRTPQLEIAYYFRWPAFLHNVLAAEHPEDAALLLRSLQETDGSGMRLGDKAATWICQHVCARQKK